VRGNEIVQSARAILNDADAIGWTDSDFVTYITAGERYTALIRPDSTALNTAFSCANGPKQSIAALATPGARLLDVVRNLTTGRPVSLVERAVLDQADPGWYVRAPSAAVRNFAVDNRDPKTFYVAAPATAGTQLEILYSRIPSPLTTVGQLTTLDLTLDDIYFEPLLTFVLYRAHLKEVQFSNKALAQTFMEMTNFILTGKSGIDSLISPDMNAEGGKPSKAQENGGV
jgi:hypothetical protein